MTTFTPNVERWRNTVTNAVAAILSNFPDKKTLINALGATNDTLHDIVLALIQKESAGNAWALGDPKPGYDLKPVSYWTEATAQNELENYNSVGLMQLNYGAGTPQARGFGGTKDRLLIPSTNVYFGTLEFLYQLERYRDFDRAVLAYNAGSYRTNEAGLPINADYLAQVLAFLGEKKTLSFWVRLHSAPGISLAGDGEQLAPPTVTVVDHTGAADPTTTGDGAISAKRFAWLGAIAGAIAGLAAYLHGC